MWVWNENEETNDLEINLDLVSMNLSKKIQVIVV